MSKRKHPGRKPSERRAAPIPPEADRLRDAHKVIDPHQTFEMAMPDGSTFTTTGAEMIETADAFLALVDAQRAGNKRGMVKALERIASLP